MKSIDEKLRFYLSGEGWYLGEAPIDIHKVKDSLYEDGIDVGMVHLSSDMEVNRSLACTDGERILISESLAWIGSIMQIKLATLHEYAHIKFGHCRNNMDMSVEACHEREYLCDLWALKQLIGSMKYNIHELVDAINLFGDVVNKEDNNLHPSSKKRHKRLMGYLRRWGLI